ncbi:MAG TPA: glycosyltransferase [Gemmatimonadaceae bacterium]|nr:glycosyltransferase [Gemmatimonadaceae bacterium]
MSDRKYLIAHNASPILGGGEIWTARLLAGLQSRGHRVLLLCRNAEVKNELAEYGIPTQTLVLRGDAMFSDAIRFAWMLNSERPDALLLTTYQKTWLGGMAASLARTPRLVIRVGALPKRPGALTYRIALARWIDAVAVNADTLRGPMIAALPTVPTEKFVTIHDGIRAHTPDNSRVGIRKELGIPANAPVIGSVGRLVKQKRYDRLVRACAMLPSDVHCVIAGDGSDMASLEDLAREMGIEDRLHLPGFRADTAALLTALDVFVISSDFEGMANAMLEAMAAGIPVVSTRVSGSEEALHPPSSGGPPPGIIVGFEPDDISTAVSRLLADSSLRASMGEEGIRRVSEHFSFEGMLDQWERLLWGNFPS